MMRTQEARAIPMGREKRSAEVFRYKCVRWRWLRLETGLAKWEKPAKGGRGCGPLCGGAGNFCQPLTRITTPPTAQQKAHGWPPWAFGVAIGFVPSFPGSAWERTVFEALPHSS